MQESPQVRNWQEEGRRETRIDSVRRAIRIRFGTPMPADRNKQLATLTREADLNRWFKAASTAPLDLVRATVQRGRRKRKRSRQSRET